MVYVLPWFWDETTKIKCLLISLIKILKKDSVVSKTATIKVSGLWYIR